MGVHEETLYNLKFLATLLSQLPNKHQVQKICTRIGIKIILFGKKNEQVKMHTEAIEGSSARPGEAWETWIPMIIVGILLIVRVISDAIV